MRLAYKVAKGFYAIKGWNKKTCPIAVIARNRSILAVGVAGRGMHQFHGKCSRTDKPGSKYDECEYCREDQHAEQQALEELRKSPIMRDPTGATCYLYGHYKMCSSCIAAMHKVGITDFVLLENSAILFNRHVDGTVVGTPQQFTA
jgi:deoxycytidylate deaminase